MSRDLSRQLIGRAMRLAAAVRDYEVGDVAAVITNTDSQHLRALCVTLAAMVDVDKPASELLAWNDAGLPDPLPFHRTRSEHGTHARFNLHKQHGERPCLDCVEGERVYQRHRQRRRRAEARRAAS